jgi:hypothetical protein
MNILPRLAAVTLFLLIGAAEAQGTLGWRPMTRN